MCFSLYICAQTLSAQAVFHRLYTPANGLPSTNIYSVSQDKAGYIWVCTDKGITRFDGVRFHTFTVKSGLPSSDVWMAQEDQEGRLWLNTFNGIAYIKHNQVFSLPFPKDRPHNLVEHEILDDGRHLVLLDAIPSWLNGQYLSEPLFDVPMKWVRNGKDGPVFATLGRNQLSYKNWQTAALPFMKIASFQRLGAKSWYFPANSAFILGIGPDSAQMRQLRLPGKPNVRINVVRKMAPDKMLCLTDSGPIVLDSMLLAVPGYEFLQQFDLQTAFEDRFGNCWICTREGLCLVPAESRKAQLWKPFGKDHLQEVSALCAGRQKGVVWVGSMRGELSARVDGLFLPAIQIFPVGFHDPKIRSVLASGGYLFITGSFGLQIYDEKQLLNAMRSRRDCKPLRIMVNPEISAGKTLDGIHPDSSAALFSMSGGLYKVYREHGKWALQTLNKGRSYHAQIQGTHLWIGKMSGLYLQDPVLAEPKHCADLDSAFAKPINALKTDPHGGLWVGTDGYGLYYLDAKGKVTEIPIPHEDVLTDLVYRSSDSTLWASCNGGLFRVQMISYAPLRWKLARYAHAHGLFSDEISCIQSFEDEILIGSKLGVSVFTPPGKTPKQPELPLLGIDEIKINGVAVNATEKQFNLRYDENQISLLFHGRSYKSVGDIQCEYRVNGLDTLWKPVNGFQLDFPKLQPGLFNLQLRALDMNGLSSPVLNLAFQISPPWWERNWVRFGSISVLLLGGWAIGYRRVKQIRKEETAKTQAARRVLELEFRALQAQMNPHFIYNALHGIQDFIFNRDERMANQYIVRFSRLMRSFLESSYKRRVLLSEEIALLRTYIELEQIKMEGRFEFEIVIDPALHPAQIDMPPLFLQPFVENAIRHGLAPLPTAGKLLLTFFPENDGALGVIIEDNGIGRKQSALIKHVEAEKHTSRGMDLVEERRKNLYTLDDTEVHILVEDLPAPNTGTRVRVLFGKLKPI